MRKILISALFVLGTLGLVGCSSPADTVSYNLSKDADDFKVKRKVVLYNGITDTYTLAVTGFCSLNNDAGDSVTCKVDEGVYLKHIFRMGDNMTLFAEQLEPKEAKATQYKVYFRPETILPDFQRPDTDR
jgi:hypothetical protein